MVELGSKLALLKMPIRKWPPTRHQQTKQQQTNKNLHEEENGILLYLHHFKAVVWCVPISYLEIVLSPELLHIFLDFLEPEPRQSFSQ